MIPIFHAQNREPLTIVEPGEIPVSPALNYIWLDSDNANVNLSGSDILSYKNKAKVETITCDTNDGISTSLPTHVNADSNFNGEDSTFCTTSGIGTVGIGVGQSTTVYESKPPILYKDYTLLMALRYDTANIDATGRQILNIVQLDNLDWQALCLDTDGIGFYDIDQIEGIRKGYTPHLNSGVNNVVIASTTRKLWVNGIEKLDLGATWIVNDDTEPKDDFSNSYFNRNASSLGNFNKNYRGYFAESIHYGYALQENQIKGLTNYLNNKYQLY
jgi:hypothetical protein